MIQVSPVLDQTALPPILSGEGEMFVPRRVWLTGWRWLVEYRPEPQVAGGGGGGVLWGDLPHGEGFYHPLVFDPQRGELLGNGRLEWWARPLVSLCREPRRTDTAVRVERLREGSARLIFLNTLDFLFGHSLLLLLNAQRYLDHYPDAGLVVIITPELRPYIPAGVAEVWELQVPCAQTPAWHASLSELFAARIAERPGFIGPAFSLPSPVDYDLGRFGLGAAEMPTTGRVSAPHIVFTFRGGSRLWGGSWPSERRRLARLAGWLRAVWPSALLEIFGHQPLPEPVPGWKDGTRHADQPPADYEGQLVTGLRGADLVLGAHGSNLLLATALARRVLALVPLDKHASLLQDCLFDARRGLREQFWRLRFLYGNDMMNDLGPRQVALLIHTMIAMQSYFDVLQADAWARPALPPSARAEFSAGTVSAGIKDWEAGRRRLLQNLPWTNRFWQWLRRQASERD